MRSRATVVRHPVVTLIKPPPALPLPPGLSNQFCARMRPDADECKSGARPMKGGIRRELALTINYSLSLSLSLHLSPVSATSFLSRFQMHFSAIDLPLLRAETRHRSCLASLVGDLSGLLQRKQEPRKDHLHPAHAHARARVHAYPFLLPRSRFTYDGTLNSLARSSDIAANSIRAESEREKEREREGERQKERERKG